MMVFKRSSRGLGFGISDLVYRGFRVRCRALKSGVLLQSWLLQNSLICLEVVHFCVFSGAYLSDELEVEGKFDARSRNVI